MEYTALGKPEVYGVSSLLRTRLQGEYCLSYGAVGTRVALIASEPITGQAGDWVAVPNNTALVVISEKVCMTYTLFLVCRVAAST